MGAEGNVAGLRWVGWRPHSNECGVASVRTRCLNPLRALQEDGRPVELFRDGHDGRYSAVVYTKAYDEAAYREACRLKKGGVRIVFDLCDNHFYDARGDHFARDRVRRLVGMMTLADHLVASTETLAAEILARLGEQRPIAVIGDAVEGERELNACGSGAARWLAEWRLNKLRKELHDDLREGRTSLVWFGLHGGPAAAAGMLDLLRIRDQLEQLSLQYPISLSVISSSWRVYRRAIADWRLKTRYLPWHPYTFLRALSAHVIAVLPISPNPFTVCKTNNRLVAALQAGLAVVADSIPSYEPFRSVCVLDDWKGGLESYVRGEDLRRRHVERAREIIRQDWNSEQIAARWWAFLEKLA